MTDDTHDETLAAPQDRAAPVKGRDRVLGWRGAVAVALASVILGGAGGAVLGAAGNNNDDDSGFGRPGRHGGPPMRGMQPPPGS